MYKTGIYLRISNEDGDKKESDSIASQRSIAMQFIEKQDDMLFVGEFVDDGYSGTNFTRPGFAEMMLAIERREIDCVIVKDLSRFGRNYYMAGYYLEKVFPMNNVRFIAVNDFYDSVDKTANSDILLPFKNILNSQYSKDISVKVRSALQQREREGEFIGAFACYGYRKDPNDKHRLLIDEGAAEIVRRIYSLYNAGNGKIRIANLLNEEGIPCPSEYKKLQGQNYRNCNRLNYTSYWTYSTIHHILIDECYAGVMIQNKSERKVIRGKATKVPKERQIRIAGTHEAIIDRETWEITQQLIKHNGRTIRFDSHVGLFAGYLYCGDCGRRLAKVISYGKTQYICGTYKRYSTNLCGRHSVAEEFLEKAILTKINEALEKLEDDDFESTKQAENEQAKESNTKILESRLARIQKLSREVYEDYKMKILTQEEYFRYKEEYSQEEKMIRSQMAAVTEEKDEKKIKDEWVEQLRKFRRLDKLDRTVLPCILDSITVYENDEKKTIDIKLKYEL